MCEISVVIPSYNSSKYIDDAINSVLIQTFKPIEIIVIDDGSFDDTRNLLSDYIYNRKINYYYQENSGSGVARNKGISKANGEYIAFLDSDDYWDKNHLKDLIDPLKKNPKAALVYSGKRWVDKDGELLKGYLQQQTYPRGWIFNALFNSNYISSSSVVIARKEFLIEIGGFRETEALRNVQDYDLWLRLSAKHEVESVPKITVSYRRHDDNRTNFSVSREVGIICALKNAESLVINNEVDRRNNPDPTNTKKRLSQQYVHSINSLLQLDEFEIAKKFSKEYFDRKHFKISFIPKLLLVFLPAQFLKSLHKLKNFF